MGLAACALALSGFAALALCMARHHRQVFGRDPGATARLLSVAALMVVQCQTTLRR